MLKQSPPIEKCLECADVSDPSLYLRGCGSSRVRRSTSQLHSGSKTPFSITGSPVTATSDTMKRFGLVSGFEKSLNMPLTADRLSFVPIRLSLLCHGQLLDVCLDISSQRFDQTSLTSKTAYSRCLSVTGHRRSGF